MAIEITYERFVSENNEPKVKIEKVKALSKEQLPELYFENVFSKGNSLVVCYWEKSVFDSTPTLVIDKPTDSQFKMIVIKEGKVIHKKNFEYYISLIHEAGERLMKINKKLRKETKDWHGKKKLKI